MWNSLLMKTIHATLLLLFLISLTACQRHSSDNATGQATDSIYTGEYIISISFTHPDRALKLVDEAEQRQLHSPFYLNQMRSSVYQNGLSMYRTALTYSLLAYRDPEARQHPEETLQILELIVDQYHTNGNYAESIRYAIEGIELARQARNTKSEANLLVYIGLNKYEMRLRQEAYEYLDRAIALLKRASESSRDWNVVDDLIYAYGQKINLLLFDGKYSEAITLLPCYEQVMKQFEACPNLPEGFCDMRYASGYIAYACIFHHNGEPERAQEYYRKFLGTAFSNTPDGEAMKTDYLLLAGQYTEALHHLLLAKRDLQENTDTLNYDYIDRLLANEVKIYNGMGNYRAAARTQATMLALTDSLHRQEKQNAVLELATIYETKEKEALLQEQKTALTIRNLVIGATLVVILLSGLFMWHIISKSRIIKEKNRTMARNLKELIAYKDEVQEARLRINSLNDEAEKLHAKPKSPPSDQVIFNQLNKIVKDEKLYLQPNLTRDELAYRIHIDKNDFSKLLQKCIRMKFYEYINSLCVEHALHLIATHPEYTFEAIATDSGFANRGVFYDKFKKRVGMTPSDYRKTLSDKK